SWVASPVWVRLVWDKSASARPVRRLVARRSAESVTDVADSLIVALPAQQHVGNAHTVTQVSWIPDRIMSTVTAHTRRHDACTVTVRSTQLGRGSHRLGAGFRCHRQDRPATHGTGLPQPRGGRASGQSASSPVLAVLDTRPHPR